MEMLGKMIMSEFGKEGQRGMDVNRRFDVTEFHQSLFVDMDLYVGEDEKVVRWVCMEQEWKE